jgi:hypothetical protein
MSSDLPQSGEIPSQGDPGGDDQRFDREDIIQLEKGKMDMKEKEPLVGPIVTKKIRFRNRVYCDSCKIRTGRRKGKCVKCGGGACSAGGDGNGKEMLDLTVANAGGGLEEASVSWRGEMNVNAQSMVIQLSYDL